jgi:hypothetical protein
MPGAPDPRYVLARTVLLDALDALGDQRRAVIVVGAQAVYLHTGAIDLGVPEFTLDADITFDPTLLREIPEIEAAMLGARFVRGNRVGVWIASRIVSGTSANVEVDLMVPDAVGGPGRRAARLRGHAREVVRKTRGLEAALIDKTMASIRALEPADPRSFDVAIAGPAALLIAKAHKIAERIGERTQRRLEDKDAFDILRLLQATETATLTATVRTLLQADVAGEVTREALEILRAHFTDARADGPQMAVRAAGALLPAEVVAASCATLTSDFLRAVDANA